jgi:hypothetical protein
MAMEFYAAKKIGLLLAIVIYVAKEIGPLPTRTIPLINRPCGEAVECASLL